MNPEDLDEEIEKLKAKRVELAGRANITRDLDEKEDMKEEIKRLQKQIDTLEKYYGKKS